MKALYFICMEISYLGQFILQPPRVPTFAAGSCQQGRSVNANGVCRIGRSAASPEVGTVGDNKRDNTEHLQ